MDYELQNLETAARAWQFLPHWTIDESGQPVQAPLAPGQPMPFEDLKCPVCGHLGCDGC